MASPLRTLGATCAIALASLTAGCSTGTGTGTEVTVSTAAPTATNVFLPDQQELGNCVNTNERPNCGSPAKGGRSMGLVFGALMLGMGFVAWRVVRGVRARDAIVNRSGERNET